MCQSTLTPTESSLLTQCASSEAEALSASSDVIHRETERAFFALITLSSNDQFLENYISVNFSNISLGGKYAYFQNLILISNKNLKAIIKSNLSKFYL